MIGRVYPRACGGTFRCRRALSMLSGLSPRVRGNLRGLLRLQWSDGSIPARAGEPTRATVRWLRRRVYPRACGGTFQTRPAPGTPMGLSPRVRGNPRSSWTRPIGWGSIPARAGEPSRYGLTFRMPKVYPRACGGTRRPRRRQPAPQGLSPRVRGNRKADCPLSRWMGSIPARAGEPARWLRRERRSRVYPRACGGTGPGR